MTRILVLLVFAAGCFGGDDGECLYYPTGEPGFAANELRDPATGVCQTFGGGGYCNDPCGPCPDYDLAPDPDWGSCYSQCESLDESTCKSTSGCRAAYAGDTFHQCWAVAPSGPVQGGGCDALDAQGCSRHDDCVARHAEGVTGSQIGSFLSCAAEGSVQDPGSCVGTVTCTTQAPQCPANTIAGRRNGCWTGYCIPYAQCDTLPACDTLEEPDCISRSDCAPTYEGVNCTCTGSSCTCQSWLFDACRMN